MSSHLIAGLAGVYLMTCVFGLASTKVVFVAVDCLAGQLVCQDGKTCVEETKFCDGTLDCPDGDDEGYPCVKPLESRVTKPLRDENTSRTTKRAAQSSSDFSLPQLTCPKHQIPCADAKTCISQQASCNGVRDCPDGDDETTNCIQKTLTFFDFENIMIPCFQRVKKAKNISHYDSHPAPNRVLLSNCPEDDVDCTERNVVGVDYVGECPPLPKHCQCEFAAGNMLEVSCATNGKLRNLAMIHPSPNRLSLRSPALNLTSLGPKSVDGKGVYVYMDKLLTLDFSRNGLNAVHPFAFQYHNLENLDLSINNLTTLRDRTFQDTNVCWLNLGANRLVDWEPDAFQRQSPVLWLDVRGNMLTLETPGMMRNLIHTSVIELRNNNIRRITNDTFKGLAELRDLDMAVNHIEEIEAGAFSDNVNLRTLILGRNNITRLPEDLFSRNPELCHLELAHNPIRSFPLNLFRNFNCTTLDLEGVVIDNIDENMFRSLPPTCIVMFEKLYYCFTAPQIRNCTPKFDGISSFENLLVSPLLVSLAWILGVFTIVSNLAVFSVRWYLDRSLQSGIHEMVVRDARVMSLFVKHLSLSDLLTGVYLLGICYHNELWRGEYNRHAVEWVHSGMCKGLGIVAMSSAEISMMILTFIAVDRFVTIVWGLHKPKCSIAVVRVILLLLWLSGLTIAIVPAFLWGDRVHDYYGNNGVCLPLYLQEPHLDGWIYSLVVLIGLNGCMIVLIILSYAGIFISIRRWRHTEKPAGTDERQERELLWRFFVLVFVNLCCWIPTFVFKILAVTSYKVPDDSYAWIVTFVFPLNGAMNPIVYSLSSSEFRSRVSHVTGCHRVYIVLLRRLHVLHRRLSAPFTNSNDLSASVEVSPTDVQPDQAKEEAEEDVSVSATSLCSRLREKCRTVVTPRSSQAVRSASRRTARDLRLDVPLAHEVIPLNAFDREPSD